MREWDSYGSEIKCLSVWRMRHKWAHEQQMIPEAQTVQINCRLF